MEDNQSMNETYSTEIYISKDHFTQMPDCTGRPDKERRVYELLEKLRIPFEGVDHEAAFTIEACRGIEDELGIMPCKNLFLCNRQKTAFYLLLMPGDKKFLTKDLSHQLGISRLSFAGPEYMEQYLDITPGSVSVMGLMNDTEHKVNLVIDGDILRSEYIGCHPCINTASLKIRTQDILEKFLPSTGHTWTAVEL
ncbi:MAG TPA: prolyl-tRNA synthetase associated domain-containing protein [Candidatus Mediterraneibacter cottocaccae]|nr:prolyl-tRNA synthetase associated domain-containing protein [Candidatus Mediterraneibacter cottocaccae]